ncbi:MAG: hypothetical protein QOH84_4998 [Kribbellaceae bacterium]|nr:hypothetical protein [Kribbellaceae bacterium]
MTPAILLSDSAKNEAIHSNRRLTALAGRIQTRAATPVWRIGPSRNVMGEVDDRCCVVTGMLDGGGSPARPDSNNDWRGEAAL